MTPLERAWYVVYHSIVDHPSGRGTELLIGLVALLVIFVVMFAVRRARGDAHGAAKVLREFFECRRKGDGAGMAARVAAMKFDRSGRIDDWFIRLSPERMKDIQKNIQFIKYKGKEPRLTSDGHPVGGMLSMKISVKSQARGTYDAMVLMGMRPGAPFDGKWKILLQDFIERAGPYEGPTAIYTYKKAKLSPVGEGLAKAWKAHAKALKVSVVPSAKNMPDAPPKPGPLSEPSPFYGANLKRKKDEW